MGWECAAERYADGIFCDCACRLPDPDCEDPSYEVLVGCGAGETCVEGRCQ